MSAHFLHKFWQILRPGYNPRKRLHMCSVFLQLKDEHWYYTGFLIAEAIFFGLKFWLLFSNIEFCFRTLTSVFKHWTLTVAEFGASTCPFMLIPIYHSTLYAASYLPTSPNCLSHLCAPLSQLPTLITKNSFFWIR